MSYYGARGRVVEEPAGLALVVDDVAENRDFLRRRLARRGFTVLEAEDGRSALAAVEAAPPDLVLLDWTMPGMSGLDALTAIRARHPKERLCVIMLTARLHKEDVLEAMAAGANDYLAKPVDFEQLMRRVQAHLALQRQFQGEPTPGAAG